MGTWVGWTLLLLAGALPLVGGLCEARAQGGDIRLFSSDTLINGHNTTGNLLLAEYDGFALGYDRMDSGPRQSFGVRVPFGWIAPFGHTFSLSVYRYAAGTDRETEGILTFQPIENIEIVGRGYDLPVGSGGFLGALYRANANFNAPNNFGFGAYVATAFARKVGGYGWAQIAALRGLFAGVGVYPNNFRYVLGFPAQHGPSVWYFGLHDTGGATMDQLLFATDASYLSSVDLYATIVQIKPTDGLVTNGGVFKYQFPPIAARGEGFTGGVTNTWNAKAGDILSEEAERYIGPFFVGGRYGGALRTYRGGTIGVPTGVRFRGGDGFTRNIFVLTPTYDQQTRRGELTALLEVKLK